MGGSQDLSLKVLLTAQNLGGSAFSSFGNLLGGLSGPAGIAAKAFGGITLAAIGFAAASVAMAAQYDQSMRMVQSLTGASSQQMAQYDASLKALAIDAGVAPNALAQGLYQVISAGYSGSQAMRVLTLATQDSKIGMTSAAVTSEALTNVLANFTWQTKNATLVNGVMLESVTLGKSTFQQYASTITKAASTSAQFHISLQTMSAAWATMTANGISAGKASTDYVQLVQAMDGKVQTITKSLAKNGIAFNETAFNAASFGQKVLMLNQVLQEAAAKHVQVTGVTLQAAQAVTVIAGHIGAYNSNLATLSNTQAMAQKTAQAWAITQGGFNQQLSRAGAAVQVLMIDIGQALLPVLTKLVSVVVPIISQFTAWITKSGILQQVAGGLQAAILGMVNVISGLIGMASAIVGFFQNNQVAVDLLVGALVGIGVAIGAAVIPAMIAAAGAAVASFGAWAMAAGVAAIATLAAAWPFILIGAAVAAAVAGIILAIQHWGQIVEWLRGVWNAVAGFFTGLWSKITGLFKGGSDHIAGIFKVLGVILLLPFAPVLLVVKGIILAIQHWGAIMHWFGGIFSAIGTTIHNVIDAIGQKFSDLGSFVQGVWTGIIDAIKGAINLVIGFIDMVIQKIDSIHVDTPFGSIGFNIPQIPKLATGGIVMNGGIVDVHANERMFLPAGTSVAGPGSMLAAGSGRSYGGHGEPVNIHQELHLHVGQKMTKSEMDEMMDYFSKGLARRWRSNANIPVATSGSVRGG